MLDAAENNRNRMIKIADKLEQQQSTRKKERVMLEKQQKKRQKIIKTIKTTQYEIESIVGHDFGEKSKKVVRLRIKWVGDAQTTLESVKVIKETVWEMVDEYGNKNNIAI